MDVVEVAPTGVGSADITALVADRIVREVITGIALKRSPSRPQRASIVGGVMNKWVLSGTSCSSPPAPHGRREPARPACG